MAFSVNALTTDGNALLAQATSANPIVYIGAVGSTNDYTALQLAGMSDPNDAAWDVQNGVIVASSATDITARIIMGFYNRASSVILKTAGIVGRLHSQSDAEAVVVAAVSDSTASIRIPDTTEAAVRVEIAINLAISDELSVVVTSSTAGSAMLSDLDRLVSCHKAGQPTTGETQYIYGAKHFEGIIYPWGVQSANMDFDTDEGNITWNAASNTEIEYINNSTYNESLRINADTAVIVNAGTLIVTGDFDIKSGKVLSSIIPDGSINLGEAGYEWENIYANHIFSSDAEIRILNNNVDVTGDFAVDGTIYPRGGFDFDETVPLNSSNFPFIPNSTGSNTGCIFLAIISSPSVYATTAFNAGDLIPADLNVAIANSEMQATGGLLTPQFSVGYALTNNGSQFRVMHTFQITGNKQVLALIMRIS